MKIEKRFELKERMLKTIDYFIHTGAKLEDVIYLIPSEEEDFEFLNYSEEPPELKAYQKVVTVNGNSDLKSLTIKKDKIYEIHRKDKALEEGIKRALEMLEEERRERKTNHIQKYPTWTRKAFEYNKRLVKERKEILESAYEPEWKKIIECLKQNYDFYFDVMELDLIVDTEEGRKKFSENMEAVIWTYLDDHGFNIKTVKRFILPIEWEALKHLEHKEW